MKLIVGLGNPGSKYELTRHNIGFLILDYVAEYLKVKFKTGKGEWYEAGGCYNDSGFIFMKPTTYMNNSGEAVFQYLTKNNIPLENILIISDDFQIPLGMIRIRAKGSDGGHNGISSIVYHLNSMDFPRMRIGIGKEKALSKDEYIDFVLNDFSEEELNIIKNLMPVYKESILSFIIDDLKVTMNKYNRNFLIDEGNDDSNTKNII